MASLRKSSQYNRHHFKGPRDNLHGQSKRNSHHTAKLGAHQVAHDWVPFEMHFVVLSRLRNRTTCSALSEVGLSFYFFLRGPSRAHTNKVPPRQQEEHLATSKRNPRGRNQSREKPLATQITYASARRQQRIARSKRNPRKRGRNQSQEKPLVTQTTCASARWGCKKPQARGNRCRSLLDKDLF